HAGRLRDLSRKYDNLGQLLARADQAQKSNPISSLSDYRRAREVDGDLGSAHLGYINGRIRLVAPLAARQLAADRKFEDARKAADLAPASSVSSVYKMLDTQAQQLYREAKDLS